MCAFLVYGHTKYLDSFISNEKMERFKGSRVVVKTLIIETLIVVDFFI